METRQRSVPTAGFGRDPLSSVSNSKGGDVGGGAEGAADESVSVAADENMAEAAAELAAAGRTSEARASCFVRDPLSSVSSSWEGDVGGSAGGAADESVSVAADEDVAEGAGGLAAGELEAAGLATVTSSTLADTSEARPRWVTSTARPRWVTSAAEPRWLTSAAHAGPR